MTSHSATVALSLDCGPAGVFGLSRTSIDYLELVDAADVPPGPAVLVVVIDGVRHEAGVTILRREGRILHTRIEKGLALAGAGK